MLKNYRRKLDSIETNLVKMVGQIVGANKCMLSEIQSKEFDFQKCHEQLKTVDELITTVDNTVVSTLALFSPEAKDLRELASILKITNEISRAKSNARNYGREMQEVYQKNIYSEATLDKITVLQECSIKSFEYIAMMITSEEDELSQKLYNAILAEEDKADELYGMIDQSVIESISDTTQNSIAKIDSLKAIRKLEKITDRAVGIADLIMFAQSGGEITH